MANPRGQKKQSDFYSLRYDYDTDKILYAGAAKVGSETSEPAWLIRRFDYDGDNLVAVLYANGSPQYQSVWDDRATLDYS